MRRNDARTAAPLTVRGTDVIPYMAVSINWRFFCRNPFTLLFGVYVRASDFWKHPFWFKTKLSGRFYCSETLIKGVLVCSFQTGVLVPGLYKKPHLYSKLPVLLVIQVSATFVLLRRPRTISISLQALVTKKPE